MHSTLTTRGRAGHYKVMKKKGGSQSRDVRRKGLAKGEQWALMLTNAHMLAILVLSPFALP